MLWIKRNLWLIIGVLVSLGLMALAAVYLISRINQERAATAQLADQTAELERLASLQPSLSEENIAATKAETAKIQQLVPQLQPLLTPLAVPQLDNNGYKSLLENTISQLQQEAESVGVTLPARYSFTFAAQRPVLNFPSNSLGPLTVQLEEIKTLSSILFKSKIHSLESLRRVRVYAEEAQSGDYIEGKMVLTNGIFTVTPYEAVFRAFSAELAQVLDALQHSPIFFVVKKLQVQTVQIEAPPAPPPAADTAAKGGGKKSKTAETNAPPQAALITVMEEKPLRITLTLEVVKLAQPAQPAQATQPGQPAQPAQ